MRFGFGRRKGNPIRLYLSRGCFAGIVLLLSSAREAAGQRQDLIGWVETWQGKKLGGIEILIPGRNAVTTKPAGDFRLPLPDDVSPGDEIVLLIRDKATNWTIVHPFEGRTIVPKPAIPIQLRVARKGDRIIASDTAFVRQFLAEATVRHPTIDAVAVLSRFETVTGVPAEIVRRTIETISKTSTDTLSRALAALFSRDYSDASRLISRLAPVSESTEYTHYYVYGLSKYGEGDFFAATNAFTRAIELRPKDPWLQTSLATAYAAKGFYVAADSAFTKVLALDDSVRGGGSGQISWMKYSSNGLSRAWAEREYGSYLVSVGRFTEGVNRLSSALDSISKAVGVSNPATTSTAVRLAVARANAGEWEAADSALQSALRLAADTGSAEYASLLIAAGEVAAHAGRLDEAERSVRQGLKLREGTLGPGHPGVAQALVALGNVLALRKEPALAVMAYRRALTIQETALSSSHPEVMRTLRALAQTERALGNDSAALKLESRLLNFPQSLLVGVIDQPKVSISWQ